jgi:hypothetical protein
LRALAVTIVFMEPFGGGYLVLTICVILTPILHFHLQWGHLSFPFYLGNLFAN